MGKLNKKSSTVMLEWIIIIAVFVAVIGLLLPAFGEMLLAVGQSDYDDAKDIDDDAAMTKAAGLIFAGTVMDKMAVPVILLSIVILMVGILKSTIILIEQKEDKKKIMKEIDITDSEE